MSVLGAIITCVVTVVVCFGGGVLFGILLHRHDTRRGL